MDEQKQIREHLAELLKGESAHMALEKALAEFPLYKMNERPADSPHTAWELLEHLRLVQSDILEFSRDPKHVSPDFPDGYWNKKKGTEATWRASVKQISDDLQSMRELIADEKTDLLAKIPHGDGQTIFREALLVADHNAYHLGQFVLLMKMLQ